jgi:Zn-finger nucleic acid-binding protein
MNSTVTQPALRCPKCHGDLVVYERQGIVVDQCRDCRGIWLDRGELEHLIDMEAEYVRRMSRPDGASRPDGRGDDPRGDDPRGDDKRDARRRDDDRYDARYDDRDREDRSGGRRRDEDRDDDRPRRGGDRRANLFGDIFGDILGG